VGFGGTRRGLGFDWGNQRACMLFLFGFGYLPINLITNTTLEGCIAPPAMYDDLPCYE
jgi:hypothetical protein